MDMDVYGGSKEAMTSLQKSAVSGVKWSSISQVGRQGMQLLTTVILARLLSPSDFGLVGMAMVVIGFVTIFKDLGTSAALIQRKELSEELLSGIFWVNVTFGLLATVVLALIAPVAANFYHEPRIIPILGLLSLTFFISGLSILQQAILEREMAFDKLAKVELFAIASGSVVGIGTALLGAGVWSLVYQTIVVAVVTTILLWISSKWRPKIIFHWAEVKSISSYSLNLTGFQTFNYFSRNADYLLIGRYLGTQDLGYYTLAYRIMLYPLQSISSVLGRVMFPVFSQMQVDDERFRRAYLKVTGTIALVTLPMMLGLWVIAEPFVITVFGMQWKPVITLLIVLAPVGMVQSIGSTVGTIYQAKGRTDWMFRWGVAAGILVVIAFVIGLQWGIIGVALAYTVTSLILTYPNFAIPFKLINLPMKHLWQALWRPFLCSLIMLMILFGLKTVLPENLSNGMELGISVFIGVITYLFISWIINRVQIRQILEIVGVRV